MADHDIMVYALKSCRWCHKTKMWFSDENIPFEHVDVDALEGDEYTDMKAKVQEISGGRAFPVTVIDGEVIVGFKPELFAEKTKPAAAN